MADRMNITQRLYGHSLALLTDLYQLTMAQGYWKIGAQEKNAVFHLFFRRAPFGGAYTVACGLRTAIEVIESLRFDDGDLEYLATLTGNDDERLFEPDFLEHLRQFSFEGEVEMVREGTLVFPQEPLVRVRGPLLQCQLLETPLLNVVNFQTLIATKASRICRSARGEPVLEFGLRRAHGIDGGVSASRAAFVGGCAATSNVLAGRLFDIPVKGTHAHSWVMSFDTELESFQAYAEAMPNNCVFLVDTYDTLEGVRRATEVGRWLRQRGHEMVGIRLDSGDLTQLSIDARKLLDEAGFPEASIVASNDLSEHSIDELKREGATIGVWGVGTKLATAYDEPALGGVYKLSAIRADGQSEWDYKVKRSEQAIKSSNPGIQQVRRYIAGGQIQGDVIWDEGLGVADEVESVDLVDPGQRTTFAQDEEHEDLLQPAFRDGAVVFEREPVTEARARATRELERLGADHTRLDGPARYPVGLERRLYEVKTKLLERAKARQG